MNQKEQIEHKFNTRITYNIKLVLFSLYCSIAFIHHNSLYSFPPDFSAMKAVPPMAYVLITFLFFTSFKIHHNLVEKSEILGDGK